METSLPQEFIESLSKLDNIDAEALAASLSATPSIGIRFNARKATAEERDTLYPGMSPVEWCEDGRRLSERPFFTANPLLHAGVFYVQDPSSMIHQQIVAEIVRLLRSKEANPTKELKVLDFCAAPGGKTTAMINGLPDGTMVVANEYEPRRGRILRENLEKWGYPRVIVTGDDAKAYSKVGAIFDIVAVDAPCSGEGMMRKEEEARRQWSAQLVSDCAALQRSILDNVALCVRPGGYLIYSTCTFNREEDEDNARYIIEKLGFESVSLSLKGIEKCGASIDKDIHALRFMPHLTDGEGLFVAVFRRREGEAEELETYSRSRASRRHDRKSGGKSEKTPTISWIEKDSIVVEGKDVVSALPLDMGPLLERIKEAGVNVTAAGFPVAQLKGREYAPDSRVALSSMLNPGAFPVVEVEEAVARQYLRREAIVLPPDTPKGYVVVAYKGHPLGMVKNLGNRANNLFPQHWKIRAEV